MFIGADCVVSLAMTVLEPVIASGAATKQSLLVVKSGTELTKSNTKRYNTSTRPRHRVNRVSIRSWGEKAVIARAAKQSSSVGIEMASSFHSSP